MNLILSNPQQDISQIVAFLRQVFQTQGKKYGLVAISGGIDSAVSATLLTQALGAQYVIPVFLPYGDQSVDDSQLVAEFNHLPVSNWHQLDIKPMVELFAEKLGVTASDNYRRGNLMARCRMICCFDIAKDLDALVCGTENKSEEYLGYFTRFGDEASDIEPLQSYYKTQVRQLASSLHLPKVILTKAPSAGLWSEQTDEKELGFSYQEADQVLAAYIDEQQTREDISLPGISSATIDQVIARVATQRFKRQVPYAMNNHRKI